MRVDFNVPLNNKQEITDDTRIRLTLPSINYILSQGASLVLMSHLGRPKGRQQEKYSLSPVAKALSKLLGQEVALAPDSIGQDVLDLAEKLRPGQVLLLENLRFHRAEEKPGNDPSFAEQLSRFGDIFINDAFGACHREHSSITSITRYFPKASAMGFLLKREIENLSPLINDPPRPFSAIFGGAKISTKIGLLKELIQKVDEIFIGGGLLFTFLKAKGQKIGRSLFDEGSLSVAADFIKTCENLNIRLHFPSDLLIANEISESAELKVISGSETIPDNFFGVDIGPKTLSDWEPLLQQSKTLFWNGPMGIFEIPSFSKGTFELAKLLSHVEGNTIIGGGDSLSAIHQLGIQDMFTHLSTGGGASLEFIEKGHLPGIDHLSNR